MPQHLRENPDTLGAQGRLHNISRNDLKLAMRCSSRWPEVQSSCPVSQLLEWQLCTNMPKGPRAFLDDM